MYLSSDISIKNCIGSYLAKTLGILSASSSSLLLPPFVDPGLIHCVQVRQLVPVRPNIGATFIGTSPGMYPLVLEIKVYDASKSYRKNRVIDGFAQIVKYANDYNKDIGYLVVFNVNAVEIKITSREKTKDDYVPKHIKFNGKTYFIIIINLNSDHTASKLGKIKTEEISEEELFERAMSIN